MLAQHLWHFLHLFPKMVFEADLQIPGEWEGEREYSVYSKGTHILLTLAVVKSTTFLLVRSHLLPTINLQTLVLAYRSIS